MHVILIEPSFPHYQRHFVRALKEVGARVTGIGETRPEHLDGDVARWLDDYQHVHSVVDEGALEWAVRAIQQRGWVDRLEATIESHVLPAAVVRERCGIPGTSPTTAFLCRDKPSMKQVLRDAGVPTAASAAVDSPDQAWHFASTVGFPLILKPRSSAGSDGTVRVDTPHQLERAIHTSGLAWGQSLAMEEFVAGHEGIYDTITIDGVVVHDFIAHYFPNVLEAMRERWITPYMMVTNRMESEGYGDLRALGQRVITALGITTSATHMEWFFGAHGLKFSEIGCRPTGQSAWDLYCAANDVDVYREWAMAIVHHRRDRPLSRSHAAGMISLRPECDGHITGYDGIEEANRLWGQWVIDCHFPPTGTPTQPITAGMNANAWIRMRHPDFDELKAIFDRIGHLIRVHAA